MRRIILVVLISIFYIGSSYCQTNNITAYSLSLYSPSRNLTGKLYVKDSIANLFTGTMVIDNSTRMIYGWYVNKISQGTNYSYNTVSMVFYVQINGGFQFQQLFKGILSYDKKFLSGDYFFYGNEYPFNAILDTTSITNVQKIEIKNELKYYPNPVNNYLQFESSNQYNEIKIYNMSGDLLLQESYKSKIEVSGLNNGIYIAQFLNNGIAKDAIKFIKN